MLVVGWRSMRALEASNVTLDGLSCLVAERKLTPRSVVMVATAAR